MSEYTTRPNWLDRVAGYVSPKWGAERMAWRDAQAAYRGGVSTRLSRPWSGSTSYKGGLQSDRKLLGSMRDRARNVYDNNPIGRSLLKTETDNVVAEGLKLQSRTASKDFNREVEERFAEWLDVADVTGMYTGAELMREAYRVSRCDGDAGFILLDRGGESRLQLIPGDLISNPIKGWTPEIKEGVEINRVGKPTAFYIEERDENAAQEWTRIGADNFAYLCHPPAPLMVRGQTCYAGVFSLLDKLDDYVDAVTTAARMACLFGLLIKSDTAAKQFGALGTLTNSNGDAQKGVTLENGMLRYMGSKDDVVQVQAQQPMSQTPDFVRIVLRLIGVAFDMPLELVLKDVSQANLSSLRGGRQDYHRACRPRRNWYASHWSRIYRWWISREVNAGTFTTAVPENYWPHEFQARGWEFTDPVTEAQAKLLEIEMGIEAPQNVAASLGRDYEAIIDLRKQAAAMNRAAGLPDIRGTYTRDPMANVSPTMTPDPAPVVQPGNP